MGRRSSIRDIILRTITENPGLHFRELQRRTNAATGQLQYHLYQLEKDRTIIKRTDGNLVRYFSNNSGTEMERALLYHMRTRDTARIISSLITGPKKMSYFYSSRRSRRELIKQKIQELENDNLLEEYQDDGELYVRLLDRDYMVKILKQYRESFIDSMAINLFSLLD